MNQSISTITAQQQLANEQHKLNNILHEHPFVVSCREGRASMQALKTLLIQQGHYSGYFTRYLCALMANLSTNEQVLDIAANLFEELGFAPDAPTPHSIIYRSMLQKFGLHLSDQAPLPATRMLIDTMFSYCRSTDPALGLGAICLGAEGVVPTLYSAFISGFSAHGIDAETLHFFHLHVACDDEHAETLSKIMTDLVAQDPDSLSRITSAGEALVKARYEFLDQVALGEKEIMMKEVAS